MIAIIALNLFVIFLVVIFAAAIGNKNYDGKLYAWFAFCTCLSLSLLGWLVFVAVHFISKYW